MGGGGKNFRRVCCRGTAGTQVQYTLDTLCPTPLDKPVRPGTCILLPTGTLGHPARRHPAPCRGWRGLSRRARGATPAAVTLRELPRLGLSGAALR